MTSIDPDSLAMVHGGIWYGETKSPTGERWAAALDSGAKKLVGAIPGDTAKNVVGVAMMPTLGVGEFVARKAGAVWDYATRSQP